MFNANLGETATAVGYVRLIKHDANGVLIYDQIHKNQLTTYARSASAQMWTGNAIATPNSIQVGNGSPTVPRVGVDPSDTALWAPMAGTLRVCDFTSVWLTYTTQYSITYQQSDANGDWTEIGLFDKNGNLWSHVAVTGFTKNSGETVTVQWQIQHIGN